MSQEKCSYETLERNPLIVQYLQQQYSEAHRNLDEKNKNSII